MKTTLNILIAEHDKHDLAMIDNELKKGGIDFVSEIVQNEAGYRKALKNFIPDIILCDYRFPSFDGTTAFKIREQLAPETPFIIVSGTIGEENSIELIKNGVTDFVLKDKMFALNMKVTRALYEAKEKKEKSITEIELKQTATHLAEAQKLAKLGSWDYDFADNKLIWSEQLYNVFDTDKQTFNETHRSFLHLIDEADRKYVEKASKHTQETGEAFIIEYGITTHKGEKRVILEHGYGVKDATGKVIRLFGTAQDITERKKAENAVKESEAKYRAFFENSMDGILLTVTDGEILAANPAACKIFNMTEQEICDAGRMGIVDLSDPRVEDLIKQRQLTGEAQGELTFLRKDGTTFPGEISSVLFTDSFGQERTSMIIRDISERKETEERLALTSGKLQSALNDLTNILDSSLDVICAMDEHGIFKKVSAASEAVWGYKPTELVGKPIINFIYPEDHTKTLAKVGHMMAGNNNYYFENKYIRKDGSLVSMEWSSRWDKKARLRYGVARDVTEKKRLEKAIYIERQRFLGLYLQSPSCMGILKGPNHVYETANPLYLQLIGKTDIIGKTVKEVLPEMESQGAFELLDNVYKTGNTFSANEMLIQFDLHGTGKLVDTYLNFIYQAHRDDQNEIDGILFFAIDVTEQVISRKTIEESERKLKEAQAIARISNWDINLETNTHQWSAEFYDIMRIKPEEVKPSVEAFLSLLHPDDVEQAKKSMQNTFDTFQESFFYSRINTKDGITTFVYSEWKFEFDKTNKPIRLYGILQDVTERKIAEKKLIKSNRLYAFISAINQSIVHIKEEEELLKKACSIAMEIGNFKTAWIGLLNEEDKLEVINVLGERAISQIVEKRSGIDVQNSPFRNTGVGKALRNGIHAVSNDVLNDPDMYFLHEELLNTGIRANIVFPIKKSGKVAGVFSFNSDTVNFFDEAEIAMLQDAVNDISFALENFMKAARHNVAEEKLKENYTLLRITGEIAKLGGWYVKLEENRVYWSDEVATLHEMSSGYEPLVEDAFKFYAPEWRDKIREVFTNCVQKGIPYDELMEIYTASGKRIWVRTIGEAVKDRNGKIVKVHGAFQDVTERKQIEKALEEYKYALDESSIVAITDQKGIIKHVNENFCKISKYSAEELIGQDHRIISSGYHPKSFIRNLWVTIANGKIWRGELRNKAKDGSIYWVDTTIVPLLDEQGNPLQYIAIRADITKRKKAEGGMKLLSKRLQLATNSAGMGIWDWDIVNNLLVWDEGMYRLYKIDEKQLGSDYDGWTARLHPQDIKRVNGEMQNAIEGKKEYDTEFRIVLDDSSVRYLKASAVVERDAEGNALNMVGANWDITELKEKENQLIVSSNERQRALKDLTKIMDSSLDVICTINADGEFVNVSPASQKVWGYKPEELIGSRFMNLVYHEDADMTYKAAEKIANNIQVPIFENRYIHKSGSVVPILWSVNWDENLQLMFCIAKDVTEKKRLEKAFEIERQRFFDLFSEAPSSMGVLSGPDHRFEMANPPYLKLIGKKDIIGKTVKDVLPEVVEQGFIDILDSVYRTGKTFSANEMIIKLDVNNTGKPVDRYLNFMYQPHIGSNGKTDGILFFIVDVSEQVLSRKKIEESYKEFQFVTDFMPQLIWVTKPDGYHYYYNKQWYDYTGLAPHESEGEGWNQVFHPDDQDRAWGLWRHSLETGEPYEIEYRCRRHDGEYRWFLGRALPLKDSTGSILKWFGTCTDINDQKRATESLRKSEERYRQIVDTAQEGIWVINEHNKTTFVNSKMGEILGYGVNEMMGKELFDFMDEEGIEMARVNVEERKQGHSGQHKFKFVSKAGKEVWTNLADNPLFNEDGSYTGALAMVTDITLSQKAEEKIIESEKEIRTMAESMPQIVWVTTADGKNIYFNQQWVDYTGLTHEESYGDGWLMPIHKHDKPIAREAWNNAVANQVEYSVECRLRRYDGTYHWWLLRGVPKMNEKGEILKWYGTCTDIEKIKQAELEKEKISRDLIQRNKNLEQFSYIISHNLRAPVANILGFAELMKYANSDPVLMLDSMKGMSIAAQKMDNVIKDLNEILQIRTDVSENKEELHFQALVEDISLSINNILKKENAIIRTDFSSIDKMLTVKSYLYSVFYNLILNSIKYHKPGVSPLIEIKSQRTSSGLQLIFKDNGMGIDLQKHQQNLFGLYKRFHLHVEGKGMGMFMVKTHLEILGGQISVSSEVNNGSEFTIEFKNIHL